jgi:DNA invertase Pin-like site-specific DNA recombinase
MRIAIYARVSTDDKGQDPENQLRQLRQWCASAGHELVHEYVDHESGRKGTKDRKQFAALFEDAHKRKFDCVLFWALDRFTREGMVPTIMHLQRLASYGVGFHSYTEPHLATDNELVRNILLALLASLAKVEAQKISERTRAGMARAKAQGKRIGRPSIAAKLRRQIAERTQQPNTADSQGPSGLDFINEFQCTNRLQKRQEHIMIRASGKRRHICHSCRKQLKQLFFFFHVAIMSRSSADLLVNKSVLFDPLKCLDKRIIRCARALNFSGRERRI